MDSSAKVFDDQDVYGEMALQGRRMTVEELCSKLNTDPAFGLSEEVAKSRLERHGKNIVPVERSSRLLRYLRYALFSWNALVSWTAVSLSIGSIIISLKHQVSYWSWIVVLVLLLFHCLFNGALAFVQGEKKCKIEIPSMKRQKAEVMRAGERRTIPTEDIVVGDLILLKYGQPVPADVRIIESQNFKVNNSILMGTDQPQLLTGKDETNAMEERNVAYFPVEGVTGTARGIVIRTGNRTMMARIVDGRKKEAMLTCPIISKVLRLLNIISVLAICFAFVYFCVFWLTSGQHPAYEVVRVLLMALTSIVPENLLGIVFVACCVYVRKMSQNCIVKDYTALQRLPFVEIICLCKPGVLTQNKLSVMNLWYDKKTVEIWAGHRMMWKEKASPTFRELARFSLLCNGADFLPNQHDVPVAKRNLSGNPYDVAIFKFFLNTIGKKANSLKNAGSKLFWEPYGTVSRCNLSVLHTGDGYQLILAGSPEELVEKCSTYTVAGKSLPIDSRFLKAMDKACVRFTSFGEVLICVIEQHLQSGAGGLGLHNFTVPDSGYRFVGMFSILDPPRTNLGKVVVTCKRAGIKVILATNDHPITARSFARQIGIISDENRTIEEMYQNRRDINSERKKVAAVVIEGMHLQNMSRKRINQLWERYPEWIISRITAIQKLLLVSICQQGKRIVAVVGDVNQDKMALRKADLGITLYSQENELSKFKTDLYMTDESFSPLLTCIEEGRIMLDNVKKIVAYKMASRVPGILSIVAYCLFRIPLPTSPVGLFVAEFLDTLPAVTLIFEKSQENVMRRPLRHLTDEHLCSRQMIFYAGLQLGLIESLSCFFTYFLIMLEYGWSPLSLIGIRDLWESSGISDLKDSYGQEWSFEARRELEFTSQTGYFFAIIIMQCANLLIFRTQHSSIMRLKDQNWMVFFGVLFELSIALFLIYVPQVNDFMQFKPLKPIWWVSSVPFLFLLFLYDEGKKYIVRRSPGGWFARENIY